MYSFKSSSDKKPLLENGMHFFLPLYKYQANKRGGKEKRKAKRSLSSLGFFLFISFYNGEEYIWVAITSKDIFVNKN